MRRICKPTRARVGSWRVEPCRSWAGHCRGQQTVLGLSLNADRFRLAPFYRLLWLDKRDEELFQFGQCGRVQRTQWICLLQNRNSKCMKSDCQYKKLTLYVLFRWQLKSKTLEKASSSIFLMNIETKFKKLLLIFLWTNWYWVLPHSGVRPSFPPCAQYWSAYSVW